MKRKGLALAAVLTAFLAAAPATGADLIGRASVIDGDTIDFHRIACFYFAPGSMEYACCIERFARGTGTRM